MLSAEERLARKEQQRAANRAAWQEDPANVNRRNSVIRAEMRPIQAELPPGSSGNSALDRLRQIMCDINVPLARRMRAAGHILRFEAAPASGAGQAESQSAAY